MSLEPGQTLLVAVSQNGGSLWLLDWSPSATVPFLGDAQTAWRAAAIALQRSIPLMWRSLRRWVQPMPHATHVASKPFVPGHVVIEESLNQGSFGLSFLLALASKVSGLALPADVIASAALDADGRLAPVPGDGLDAKVSVIAAAAPHVRRLLVAANQEDGLVYAPISGLDVVRIVDARAAIDLVFPGIGEVLAGEMSDPAGRERAIDTLFRMAAESSAQGLVSWRVIADTAERALTLPGVAHDPWDGWRLQLAQAVAARHEGRFVRLAFPPDTHFPTAVRPAQLRPVIAAHLVQHAADWAQPAPAEVLAWLEAHAQHVPLDDAYPAHLRLIGARARLLAITGRPADALAEQRALVGAWLVSDPIDEVTYPLSEWFRLAGALRDAAAFEAAEATLEAAQFGANLDGLAFVELARARAAIALGDLVKAEAILGSFGSWHGRLVDQLRVASARMRAQIARARGDAAAVEAARAEVAGSGLPPTQVTQTLALMALDDALHGGDAVTAERAVAELVAVEPQPTRLLLAHRDPAEWPSAPELVSRLYPY